MFRIGQYLVKIYGQKSARVFLWRTMYNIGSRALSFSGPLLSVDVNVCLYVCMFVRIFEVKYLEN